MAVDQMQSLKARYGVTTKRDLVRKIADEFARETGERRSVVMAEVMLDGMLEAEYQRIAGGAYDMPDLDRLTDGDETGYTILRDVRKTDEVGFDADLAYERWLENRGADGMTAHAVPAGPNVIGRQGCPLCGHEAQTREAMLGHYAEFHHVDLEEVDERECPECGSTETVDLTDEGPPEQSITVCAGCGYDG